MSFDPGMMGRRGLGALAWPVLGVPARGVAEPARGIAEPARGVAEPARGMAGPARSSLPPAPLMAYLESWWEVAAERPEQLRLARPPARLDIMALAFAKPDLRYAGGLALAGTGLQFAAPAATVQAGLQLARRANPGLRILLSVGGSSYAAGWERLNPPAIAALVRDLGLDGIDIDMEPHAPGCGRDAAGRIACQSDAGYIAAVEALRAALPRPAIISLAGWSTGAYGEGAFRDAAPGGAWAGSMLGLLRSAAAGMLDAVSVMAYDAGARYDVAQAARAYRLAWAGPLILGMAVPTRYANRPYATTAHAAALGRIARSLPPCGVFAYGLLAPSLGPDAGALLAAAGRALRGEAANAG